MTIEAGRLEEVFRECTTSDAVPGAIDERVAAKTAKKEGKPLPDDKTEPKSGAAQKREAKKS